MQEVDLEQIEDSYQDSYRLQIAVTGRKSIKVTFPYKVVEREARKLGLSVTEFLKQYCAIARYNDFSGVVYTFERIPEEEV